MNRGQLRSYKLKQISLNVFISCLATLSALPEISKADNSQRERAAIQSRDLRFINVESHPTLRFTPVTMNDGSRLTLIAPSNWSEIVGDISTELTKSHQQLTTLFGSIPPFRSSVRLLDEPSFYELTGAPAWTNAMFFRGEIIIPLSAKDPLDLDNLHRSVKHEYSHAVFSAISGGRIPGWLDEGLAQWIEGEENPALKNSLRSYLMKSDPVPLALLQGGFTKLSPQMVPAAYAQSLLAVQALLKTYGVEKIADYLRLLADPLTNESAFETTFGIAESDFEARLTKTLRAWVGVARQRSNQSTSKSSYGSTTQDYAVRDYAVRDYTVREDALGEDTSGEDTAQARAIPNPRVR